ncbi:TIGR00725 family protein [Desulfococcus sp.]|uniref:TIGR00725 family protein n=1 Tax=Desulfococcus sp. TaxID=2025834 RepID=UPI0035944D43
MRPSGGKVRIVGVMGGGAADEETMEKARELGERIALEGWVLLTGGRHAGVMAASARGAREAGGLVVGILPDDHWGRVSPYVTIPILTGMGDARNIINVLSSHVVVACPGGPGTISEIALALKAGRPVILMDFDTGGIFDRCEREGRLHRDKTPRAVIERIKAGETAGAGGS